MPIGTVTKRFDNEKNIRITFDNDKDGKTFSTNKRELYPILQEGNTVDYTTVVNGQYTNITAAILVENSAPAPATTGQSPAPRSALTDKDTLIVDQVIFKGAIDLQKQGHTPEGAAEMAVFTWNYVQYFRHGGNAPLVKAASEAGGQLVEVTDTSPLADIINNPPREAGDL
jgi:hypothetical protein